MPSTRFAPVEDVSPARWLTERITGFRGRVRDVVPAGFAAYARVFHRPDQGIPDDSPASWGEVAARHGTVLHPAAQWSALVGAEAEVDPGTSGLPEVGSLDRLTLPRLRDLLLTHTPAGTGDCYFAVWPGRSHLPAAWEASPVFRLPMRQYHLFHEPLGSVVELSSEVAVAGLEERAVQGRLDPTAGRTLDSVDHQVRTAQLWREHGEVQSPQLWWPPDHAWCVATEIDFDSTIVAGLADLVAELVAHDGIEALQVGPDTSLQHDADTVNVRPR